MKTKLKRAIRIFALTFSLPLFLLACGGADYTLLAQCLTNNGTIFYGAFWCPRCDEQKAHFGSAAAELPYIECSTPDGQGQTLVCAQKQITGYPTWEFADGTRHPGVLTPAELAARTPCMLPTSEG